MGISRMMMRANRPGCGAGDSCAEERRGPAAGEIRRLPCSEPQQAESFLESRLGESRLIRQHSDAVTWVEAEGPSNRQAREEGLRLDAVNSLAAKGLLFLKRENLSKFENCPNPGGRPRVVGRDRRELSAPVVAWRLRSQVIENSDGNVRRARTLESGQGDLFALIASVRGPNGPEDGYRRDQQKDPKIHYSPSWIRHPSAVPFNPDPRQLWLGYAPGAPLGPGCERVSTPGNGRLRATRAEFADLGRSGVQKATLPIRIVVPAVTKLRISLAVAQNRLQDARLSGGAHRSRPRAIRYNRFDGRDAAEPETFDCH